MLKFKQINTTITMPTSGNIIIATRFVGTKICRVITKLDGTTIDFTTKVNRVANLPDELFEEFHRIQEDIEGEAWRGC